VLASGPDHGSATTRSRNHSFAGRTTTVAVRYNASVTDADETELLDVAVEAARAAASELIGRFGDRAQGVHAKSTPTDLVSDADLAAETAIREVLGGRRPDDRILGEEGGETGEGGLRWLVDPLDGTVNFLFGIPAFAVSVACEGDSGTLAGVVLDVMRDECFEATREGNATLNGHAIRGSGRADLETAMVATGFGYDAAVRARQAAVVARVIPRVRDIRRVGAAALDLAWCACGRVDAYYERGVKAWDVAAGALICERAGLEVRDLEASGEDPAGLIVAPAGIIEELLGLMSR
jgi:myo-inositol-1(or 4)-monophosphatase